MADRPMPNRVGAVIKHGRAILGLTQTELAVAASTHRATLSQLECGLVPNVLTVLENGLSRLVRESDAAGRVDSNAAVALSEVQALEGSIAVPAVAVTV